MTALVLELRVAVTTTDYQRLMAFYEKALGLQPAQFWTNENGQAAMFEMGRATLEVFDEPYAASIDQLEVGNRVSGHIRFALQVPDLDAALARIRQAGEVIVHDPVITPWKDRNARVQSPDGLQITLYEVTSK